jgi:hypothetical protein
VHLHLSSRVIGPAELATLRHLVNDGTSVTEAARTLKVSRSTAYAALAANPVCPLPTGFSRSRTSKQDAYGAGAAGPVPARSP